MKSEEHFSKAVSFPQAVWYVQNLAKGHRLRLQARLGNSRETLFPQFCLTKEYV